MAKTQDIAVCVRDRKPTSGLAATIDPRTAIATPQPELHGQRDAVPHRVPLWPAKAYRSPAETEFRPCIQH